MKNPVIHTQHIKFNGMENSVKERRQFLLIQYAYNKDSIRYVEGGGYVENSSIIILFPESVYFSGKPLNQIADEDAIEVASFVYADITDGDETILFAKNYIMYSFGGWNTNKFEVEQFSLFRDEYVCQQTIDYLRSKGYLIPFGGKSVEEILKLGWVRYEND